MIVCTKRQATKYKEWRIHMQPYLLKGTSSVTPPCSYITTKTPADILLHRGQNRTVHARIKEREKKNERKWKWMQYFTLFSSISYFVCFVFVIFCLFVFFCWSDELLTPPIYTRQQTDYRNIIRIGKRIVPQPRNIITLQFTYGRYR